VVASAPHLHERQLSQASGAASASRARAPPLSSCAAEPRAAPDARTCGKRAQALRAGAGGEARLHEKQQRVLGQHRLSCTYVTCRHQAAPAARQLYLADGPHCTPLPVAQRAGECVAKGNITTVYEIASRSLA
jgi:hypothetical protein